MLRVATQNLKWGGTGRLLEIVGHLRRIDADVLVLTEYKAGWYREQLEALLDAAGYAHRAFHDQKWNDIGTLIAARVPFTNRPFPIPAPSDAWRSVAVEVSGLTIAGFYFPLKEEKAPYWDWVIANAQRLREERALLTGDFNTGKPLIDERFSTLTSSEKMEELERLGFVDCWRHQFPDGREYTWLSSAGNGFRLDHAWASPALRKDIASAYHDHETRLSRASDHSAVVVELRHELSHQY